MAEGSADERLVVMLEARITAFEKRMQEAERRGSKTYTRLRKDSGSATAAMERDMTRAAERINQGLATATTRIGGFAKAFVGGLAGGLVMGAFSTFTSNINQTIRGLAELNDAAKRSGLSTQAFQEWKYVAEANRIGVDSLVDGFKELNLRADEFIATGQGSAAEAFKRLGFSADDLREKLKNPSELMLEIVGRMQRLNRAGQIRVADEIFGGTGGERFVELLSQGEQGLRNTIARAHELGAVMDEQMLAKADELDRRWRDLTTRVGNFGKALAVALADAPYDLVQTRLREIFDEAEGRSILGDDIYDQLSRISDLSDEQVESLRGLLAQYGELEDAARLASGQMAQAAGMAGMQGFKELSSALYDSSARLREISDEFAAGAIDGETFRAKLAEVQSNAKAAFGALEESDRVDFGLAISEVDRLGGVIETVVARAKQLFDWLRAASGMAPAADGTQPVPPTPEFTFAAGTKPVDPFWGAYGGYDPSKPPKASAGSGGGAGKGKESSGRLDALVAELQTEREVVDAWHKESLDLLNAANEAELAVLGGKHEAIERLEQEHKDRLREIDDASALARVQSAFQTGELIASAMSGTSDKALRIARAFGAADALISTWRAYAKALADGGMTPWMRMAWAGKMLAAGMGAVNAIRGAGSGGGGSSAATSSSSVAAPAAEPQGVILELRGSSRFTADEVADMISQIQKSAKNGVNITTVRSV